MTLQRKKKHFTWLLATYHQMARPIGWPFMNQMRPQVLCPEPTKSQHNLPQFQPTSQHHPTSRSFMFSRRHQHQYFDDQQGQPWSVETWPLCKAAGEPSIFSHPWVETWSSTSQYPQKDSENDIRYIPCLHAKSTPSKWYQIFQWTFSSHGIFVCFCSIPCVCVGTL